MLINADFSRRAWVLPEQQQWVASPQGGVERIMLDRVGAEKARATSIVRYAPNSFFPQHSHPGGEEVLVLSGVFSEDNDHYPAGWYIRNPPGSRHQPSSLEGAEAFVLKGELTEEAQTYRESAWLRLPAGYYPEIISSFCDGRAVSLHRFGRAGGPR